MFVAIACNDAPQEPCDAACESSAPVITWSSYQGAPPRSGWNPEEQRLTPATIASDGITIRWRSPPLDSETFDGITYPPHVYASPLWIDELPQAAGSIRAVLTATSNGWVYAIAADDRSCRSCGPAPGDILWRTRVGDAAPVERLDGGMPMGVLSTPAYDPGTARLYVVALDRRDGWSAFALDASDGTVVPGWPVVIDAVSVESLDRNGPAAMQRPEMIAQRGALQLSPAGDRLYVTFGSYRGEGVGWIVAIDTEATRVRASFSAARSDELTSNGGMWGAGGPAVDERGEIWLTTGNAPADSLRTEGTWGNSLLHLDRELTLLGSYTPFNYCWLDFADMDLAASQPLLLPELPGTSTPRTVAFGSKQGNVYLVDRDALTLAAARPECLDDASRDTSLLPPEPQPQFGTRGPLNVFGPYSELYGALDFARMRSRVAHARLGGDSVLFVAGSTKAAADSEVAIGPSLARLHVVTPTGAPAYLEIDGYDDGAVFVNPGSPVVSSNGDRDAVVWVIDENAPRTAALLDPATPGPVLYAFDGESLALLWRSDDGALARGGKYGAPVIAHGVAVVATDRITAFGPP
ncbi:MAG: hypothetical protein IPK74_02655 [Deltaproteobacteria bacterium]|nr:hypothetical protein [Deltaproteobacteria bacterium]